MCKVIVDRCNVNQDNMLKRRVFNKNKTKHKLLKKRQIETKFLNNCSYSKNRTLICLIKKLNFCKNQTQVKYKSKNGVQ